MGVNPFYLQQEIIVQIKDKLRKEKIAVLQQFLDKSEYQSFYKMVQDCTFTPKYIPHQYKYQVANSKVSLNVLSQYLKSVLGIEFSGTLQRFDQGCYTILHDQQKPADLEIIYIVNAWDYNWGGSIFQVDGKGNYTQTRPTPNTLVIMHTDNVKQNQHYIKYINYNAGGNTLYLLSTSAFDHKR